MKAHKYIRFIYDTKKNRQFSKKLTLNEFNKIFAEKCRRTYWIKTDIPERQYRNKLFLDSLCKMRNYLQQEIDTKIEQETTRIKLQYIGRMHTLDIAVGKYESLLFLQRNCPKITQAIWGASSTSSVSSQPSP